jgi:hypothetical protein
MRLKPSDIEIEPSDIECLTPVLTKFAEVLLARLKAAEDRLPADRLAYSEAEAADLLGVERHVLRDARLRGEIVAIRIGKEYRYAREVLLNFLNP